LAFRDDFFARPIDCQSQAQISYEDQIGDLRAQIDGMSRRDQERAEEIKSLRQRQATLEQVTSGLAKDLLIQAIKHETVCLLSGRRRCCHPLRRHPQFRMSSPRSKLKKQKRAASFRSKRL
jgi:hypothetical protein